MFASFRRADGRGDVYVRADQVRLIHSAGDVRSITLTTIDVGGSSVDVEGSPYQTRKAIQAALSPPCPVPSRSPHAD